MDNKNLLTLALCLSLVSLPAALPAQDEAQKEIIKYRQNVMKAQGGHLGALFQIVRDRAGSWDHVAAHAQALQGLSTMVVDAFREPTQGGDTDALPAIWSDFEGFEEAAVNYRQATARLSEAAQGGDRSVIEERFKATLDACKGCHRDYREDD